MFGWTADEETSFRILDAFVDAGGNMIDTADVYSAWVPGHKGGESETVIGHWLKRDPAKRDKVIIATFAEVEAAAAKGWQPTVVFVDDANRMVGQDAEVAGPRRRVSFAS